MGGVVLALGGEEAIGDEIKTVGILRNHPLVRRSRQVDYGHQEPLRFLYLRTCSQKGKCGGCFSDLRSFGDVSSSSSVHLVRFS